MSREQAIDTISSDPEVAAVLSELGNHSLEYQLEDGSSVAGTVQEAFNSCQFLRDLDGPTLRAILSSVIDTSGPQPAE